jgi:hypothetical protein
MIIEPGHDLAPGDHSPARIPARAADNPRRPAARRANGWGAGGARGHHAHLHAGTPAVRPPHRRLSASAAASGDTGPGRRSGLSLPAARRPNVASDTVVQQYGPDGIVGHLGMLHDTTTVLLPLNALGSADAQPFPAASASRSDRQISPVSGGPAGKPAPAEPLAPAGPGRDSDGADIASHLTLFPAPGQSPGVPSRCWSMRVTTVRSSSPSPEPTAFCHSSARHSRTASLPPPAACRARRTSLSASDKAN